MNQRFIAAFVLLVAANTAWAQSKEWVTLPLGPSQDLFLETSGARTARIPVRFVDATSAPAELKPLLFDVSSKDGHGKALADQFEVTFQAADGKKDAAIEVTVAKDASQLAPGPYALSLRLATDFSDPKSVQALTITLTVPTPQLSVDPVIAGREIGFLWMADVTNKGELRLAEKGGKTPVQQLQLSVLRDVPATGQPDDGYLSISLDKIVVGPGQAASVSVSALGDFPLGKVTGKIEVRSRDLSAPVTTTFEVRTRRSLIWIVLLVGFGSSAGYLIRTWLTARKALLEAAAAASAVVTLVNKELAETSDATYKKELRGLLEGMREPMASEDADNLSKAAMKLQDDLVATRGRFEQRLQPFVQSAIALHALVDKDWRMPPPALKTINDLRDQVSRLSFTLAARDADGAKTLLSEKIPKALLTTLDAVTAAGTNLARLARVVVEIPPPLLDDDYRHISDATTTLSNAFPWPAPDKTDASVDQVATALGSWTGDGSVMRKLLASLPDLAQSLTTLAKDRLVAPGADSQFDVLVTSTLDGLKAVRFDEQAHADSLDFGATRDKLMGMRGEWLRYLIAKAPNVSQPDLERELIGGAWVAAIDRTKQAMTPAGVALGVARAAVASAAATTAVPGSPLPTAEQIPAARVTALGFQPASLLVGTVQERAALLKSARWASRLQSVLLAVLFMAGVYFLCEDTWVGTSREMMALFMLAFGLDLTADNVVGVFKKLKMPELG